MISKPSVERQDEEKAIITFLKRTKDGEYAKIDKTSLSYARMKEQREADYSDEEEYYYSVR